MWDALGNLTDTSGFVPRWECGEWSDALGWMYISADLLISFAYIAIPGVIFYFLRRRAGVPFPGMLWLFGVFILSCGLTHLIDACMFYTPMYRLLGAAKIVTAAASLATVVALIRVAPAVLNLRAMSELEHEIAERRRVEETLVRRTAELEETTTALRASETFLRLSQQAGSCGSWEIDLRTRKITLSDELRQIFGITPGRLVDSREELLAFIHPEDRARAEGMFGEMSGAGTFVGCDYRIIRSDGEERQVWSRGHVRLNPDGTPGAALGITVDVTERRQAEEAIQKRDAELRESQSRFHAFMGNSPLPAFLKDADGRLLFINSALIEAFDFHERDWYGKTDFELFPAETARVLRANDLAVLQSGQPRVIEEAVMHADGEHRWLSHKFMFQDRHGDRFLAGMAIDITEHKKAEEVLRESEARFRDVLEKLPAAAYTCDADGQITYFNRRAERLWQRAPALNDDADRYCGSFQLYAPDGTRLPHDQCWMAKALQTNEDFHGKEQIIKRPGGTQITALAYASPLCDPSGSVVGGVNVLVDISERKRAEARFALAVEASPSAMVMTNEQGSIVLVNHETENLFGYSCGELLGQPLELLMPERFREGYRRRRGSFLAHRRARRMEGTLHARRKNGEEFPVEIRLSPLHTDDGDYVLGAIVDATARRRAEQNQAELLQTERSARAAAEVAQHRLFLLAEASRLLTTAPDLTKALEGIVGAAVPRFADWCILDLRQSGILRRFAPESSRTPPAWRRLRGYGCPIEADATNPIVATIASGQARIAEGITASELLTYEGRTRLEQPRGDSRVNALVLPLWSRREAALGALVFVSGHRYESDDLVLAEELSRRVAHAVDNRDMIQEIEERAAALRSLSSQLSAAEDTERRRLALDLHDTIGLNLSVIKLNLESTARALKGQTISAEALNASLLLIDKTIEHTRDMTFDLHPAILDDLGLSAALHWYGNEFAQRVALEVELQEHGESREMPADLAHYLFRSVKELLNNVAKHAQGTRVVVTLFWRGSGLRILVTDDGRGLRLPPRHRGLGLRTIRERVTHLGGTFEIESVPQRGTQVILDVPFPANVSKN